MVDRFRSEVAKFKDALSEFETDVVKHRLLHESEDLEDSMWRVVALKKFSLHAVRNYEKTPKEDTNSEKRYVELQRVITKIIAVKNARDLARANSYLDRFILRQPTESVQESKMLKKLTLLQQYQSQIVELAKQERITHLEVSEARSCLQKELLLCKAAMEKKTKDAKSKTSATIEQKIYRKLESINVMRKLMIAILLCNDASLSDEWLDFFPTLRDPVTIDSLRK